MDPLVTGAVVGAGASLLSSAFGITSGKLNYRQSRKLMDHQNQINQANWMMNNEYNTPLNQRSRLLEAGISPTEIDTSGNVSSGVDGVGLGSPNMPDLQTSANTGVAASQVASDIAKKSAETEFTKSEKENRKLLADGQVKLFGAEFRFKEACTKTESETLAPKIANLNAQTDLTLQQRRHDLQNMTNEQRQFQLDYKMSELLYNVEQKKFDYLEANLVLDLFTKLYGLKETEAAIKRANSETYLNYQRANTEQTTQDLQKAQAFESTTQGQNNVLLREGIVQDNIAKEDNNKLFGIRKKYLQNQTEFLETMDTYFTAKTVYDGVNTLFNSAEKAGSFALAPFSIAGFH